MLLTNFKNLISGILSNRDCNVVDVAGNTKTLTPSEIVGADGLLSNGYLSIGGNDENINKDMYRFINYGDNSFTSSNQGTNISDDRIVYTGSYTNNTTSDLVVTNTGVSVHNNGWTKNFFIEISKLENPVTIKPNETKTFTIPINF